MATETIKFSIVTPERTVHEAEVDSLSLTTTSGEITVLPGHIPLVSMLTPGFVMVRVGEHEEYLAISTGFIEVREGNEVVILADSAEHERELDEVAIEKARKDAENIMKELEEGGDDEAFAHAAAALEREMAKQRVVSKKKYRDPLKR